MSSGKNPKEEQGLSRITSNIIKRYGPSKPVRIYDNEPLTKEELAALEQLRSEGQEPNFDTQAQAMPPWLT